MGESASNRGHAFIVTEYEEPKIWEAKFEVPTITLNDLLSLILKWSNSTILKIDVEGHECTILRNSVGFFQKIYVPIIFMEWTRDRGGAACVDDMIECLHQSNFALFDVGGQRMDTNNLRKTRPSGDLFDIIWVNNRL